MGKSSTKENQQLFNKEILILHIYFLILTLINSLGNDVVTINYGAIVSKDIVDQSLDLCPTCFQNLIKKWVPEAAEYILPFGTDSKFKK